MSTKIEKNLSELSTVSVGNHVKPRPAVRSRIIPSLDKHGREIIDPVPFAADLIGARTKTIEERVAEFTRLSGMSHQLVYDQDYDPHSYSAEDDGVWIDEDVEIPEFGLSPHEVAAIDKPSRKPRGKAKPSSATTPPEPSSERPHEAGEEEGDPAP